MLRAHLKITRETADHRIEIVADQPSKSFLLQFPSLMARNWAQTTDTCKDTAGQTVTLGAASKPFWMTSIGGYGRGSYLSGGDSGDWEMAADEMGIVIGTDPAAVQPDQNALISQIRSGETTGKVMYCGTYVYGLTINATTDEASFKMAAIFQNMSGGSINVNEVGIYAHGTTPGSQYPNEQQFCLSRDVVSTIALADGEILKVQYTISIAT